MYSVNCLKVELQENVIDVWGLFKEKMSVIYEIAPVKSVRLKQHGCEWFNGEILDLISKWDKALYTFKETRKEEHYVEYKRLRNLTQQSAKQKQILLETK